MSTEPLEFDTLDSSLCATPVDMRATGLFNEEFLPDPPIMWAKRCRAFIGTDLLEGIRVWYDFDWYPIVGHRKPYKGFKKCKELGDQIKGFLPPNKHPHLLLTTDPCCGTASVIDDGYTFQETETDFVVVIDIGKYLKAVSNTAVTFFFRPHSESVPTISNVRPFLETEDGKTLIVEALSKDSIRAWLELDPNNRAKLIEALAEFGIEKRPVEADVRSIVRWLRSVGAEVLDAVMPCLADANLSQLEAAFRRLDINSLSKLNSVSGVAYLKSTLETWEKSRDNGETWWQNQLGENLFVLSQVFCYPVVLLTREASLGGRDVERLGERTIDFLLKARSTNHTLLVEIKTPKTELIGPEYRQTFRPSLELAGALMQALDYKSEWLRSIKSKKVDTHKWVFDAFDPPCLIIIGQASELHDQEKARAFELFRNGLRNTSVITFDELFEKTRILIEQLESDVRPLSINPAKNSEPADSHIPVMVHGGQVSPCPSVDDQ